MAKPTVSVVIPTHDRRRRLLEAVESVREQTFRDLEILVVDDASNDGTAEAVAAIGDERIRLLRHARNRGASAARNTGIEEARGEWIAFLDSDDRWHPTKLARQMEVIQESPPDVGHIYTGLRHVTPAGAVLLRWLPDARGDISARLLWDHAVGNGSTPLIHRRCIAAAGGWDEGLASCQDWDFAIRVARVCNVAFVDEILVDVTVGIDRITTDRRAQAAGLIALQRKLRPEVRRQPRAVRAAHHDTFAQLLWQRGARARAIVTMLLAATQQPSLIADYGRRALRKLTGGLSQAHPGAAGDDGSRP